ncbi:hypothetical protein SAMN04487948_10879 [Halogranum amylolyticum]|uniref:Uncharacterized protein n=1 Tax=Halogranum amylolyticum TaxID=660520 RepID=A0A1H8TTD7_9EURY|nr:hypothetical protein [Halogranum amylolyticum]SEO93698.1 hypothetical protein SAMN04487948_10879 [Halogranum amylolyticum]
MRRVTRNLLVGIGLVVVALLALGALPSYLGTGDPYYLTAETADRTNESVETVDVSNVSARRYPYLTGALEDGRSDGYRKGPLGLKGSFTHSPFDEFDSLVVQNPDARDGDAVLVEYKGERYRVEVVHP